MTETQETPRGADAAQNATTHSENTRRLSDFRGKILKLAFELRNRGYSEACLKTLIRALNLIASRTEFDKTDSVLEYVAKGKWRDSYKANLRDFYNQYCKFYGLFSLSRSMRKSTEFREFRLKRRSI